MKTALVTGATRGIGLAIARMLASEGYALYINSRHDQDLADVSAALTAEFGVPCVSLCADVADFKALAAAFRESVGPLDVLVNNAGVSYVGLLQDMSEADWDRVIGTNLKSVFNLSKLALPSMIRRHSGCIVNISSIWGLHGASMEVAYSASKGGVDAFTQALAREVAPSGIRVNAIAAGVIDTSMNDHLSPEEKTDLKDQIGLGRFGTPQDVAELVRFLISDQAAYLTGQIIPLEGSFL